MGEFNWENEPYKWNLLTEGSLEVYISDNTDFFQEPTTNKGISTAPLFFKNIKGDFIAQVKVKPSFHSIYDGGGIMVYNNEKSWIKLCYEKTDIGCPTIVSVVTNNVSDDANGVEIDKEHIYLKVIRKNNCFCLFYSEDISNWHMVRYFQLKIPKNIKVGLEAQSPLGKGTKIIFTDFSIKEITVNNLRKGY